MRVRDRRSGFIYQTLPAINALRARFDGRKEDDGAKLSLNTALGVYVVLAELANETRGDDFQASVAQIARMCGSTSPTVRKYLPAFVEIGLLEVERVSGNAGDEPSHYLMTDPDEEGGKSLSTGVKPLDPPVENDLPPQGGKSLSTDTRKEEQNDLDLGQGTGLAIPEDMKLDAESLLKERTMVGSRRVTRDEMSKAVAALAEFNRQLESGYGIGAHVNTLVTRIRERPSWEPEKYVRLVQSAFRVRWWEAPGRDSRRPTPAVIFGNSRVFEAVAEDAAREARGEDTKTAQKRYTRSGPTGEKQGDG